MQWQGEPPQWPSQRQGHCALAPARRASALIMKHFKTSQQEQTLEGLCRLSNTRGHSEEHLGIVQRSVWAVQGKRPKVKKEWDEGD